MRFTKLNRQYYKSLGISLKEDQWDPEKEAVVNHKMSKELNKMVDSVKLKAQTVITNYFIKDKELSFEDFKAELFKRSKAVNFSEYMMEYLEQNKQSIASETYRTYKSQVTKILQFRKRIEFDDINERFVKEYEQWMIRKGNNEVTRGKSLCMLRTFINLAQKEQIIQKIHSNIFGLREARETGKF